MSRKKGMSRSEKLSAMQNLMMKSNDIWTLKELEKECPKKIGVQSMVVKDILQELVDCDLVSGDKIGSGNFYWCFQSEAYNKRKVEIDKISKQISDIESEISKNENEILQLSEGRDITDERLIIEDEVKKYEIQLEGIKHDIEKYMIYSPEYLKIQKRQILIALEAANRWTDNIFMCRSYAIKKLGILPNQFNQAFEIDDSFDYI